MPLDPNKIARYQAGLFWEQEIKRKAVKATPPKPVWLNKDYLPNYEEALAFNPPIFEDGSLWSDTWEPLTFDIEIYPNYFLICFKGVLSGRCVYFEMFKGHELDITSLKFIVDNYLIIGFNSRSFDIPILTLALAGKSLAVLNDATNAIIVRGEKAFQVLRQFGIKRNLVCNHIDVIEVCPLVGSLKVYGARLNTKQIQDLPFKPGSNLSPEQITVLRWYCFNDLQVTEDIYKFLEKDITLREMLGSEYNLELRSKSDAQIAEVVLSKEMTRLNGIKPKKTELPPWVMYDYDPPAYLNFKTAQLEQVFQTILHQQFTLDGEGYIILPDAVKALKFQLGETTYQVGAGGIHSTEANRAVIADNNCFLIERDVASYYPFIILNNELFPEQLGYNFLTVYRTIVERRLEAKAKAKAGDKDAKRVEAALKITINGSFGKFGNMHSILYSPKLLIQVTLTGQLSLLYLIEKIELAGIRVVSANTDGIVIKCPQDRRNDLNVIIAEWEGETKFKTDETLYLGLFSRSVNDYIALKSDMTCKGKGKLGRGINALFKNPDNFISITAIEQWLTKGIPIEQTIRECQDIGEFLTVRKVKGGGVKDGEYLGKVVRWYYSTETDTPIVFSGSGNMVAKSMGAMPMMKLTNGIPKDLDFAQYVRMTKKMLEEMGFRG